MLAIQLGRAGSGVVSGVEGQLKDQEPKTESCAKWYILGLPASFLSLLRHKRTCTPQLLDSDSSITSLVQASTCLEFCSDSTHESNWNT